MSIDDTATSTVPADDVPTAPSPPPADESKLSFGWIVAGLVLAALVAIVLFVTLVRVSAIGIDEYIVAPGSATDTADAVVVSGAETFDPEAEIAFTTVTISRSASIWEWFWAHFDDASEVVPAEDIDGTRTREETREVTQFQMNQSQDTATLVALDLLGFEVVPEVEGAFVLQLVADSPAQEALQLGDLITEVDGAPVRSSEDLAEAIQSLEPGDTVEISLQRAAEDGRDGSDSSAESMEVTIRLAEHPEIEGAGFLGVSIETPVRADAPFEVGFEVGRVRGPSAGLAFSLAIVDVLSEGELTGGIDIATTGTIDRFGNVGAVGGVPQKIEAAHRAGIELFLVPPSELVDAVEAADGRLEVRCVQTLDDAVLVLIEFGGNGLDVLEQFGAPPLDPSPSLVDPEDGFLGCAEAEALVEAG
ncbi:MAG: YlbL family protein [Acidimicrobiales bacterium]